MPFGILPHNCHGTIRPAARQLVINDCRDLARWMGAENKMKNLEAIIKLLLSRTNKQRQAIQRSYSKTYLDFENANLKADLLSTFGTEWDCLLSPIFQPWMEFEAYRLHSAIRDGNDSVALEILMGQDSKTVEQIAEAYQQIFKKQLSDCVKYNEKLLSAPILHVILTEARNDARDPVNDELFLVDPINLTRDAKFMIATPMDEWLSLDTTFVRLIGHENFAHIHAVLKALELDSGHTIEEILNSRKCADFRKKEILLLIIKLVKNQPEYFARRFQDIFMNQRQENEDISDLIILLLSRCERDLKSIKVAYEDLYEDDTLGNAVNRCVPSKFKQFVTSIVDGN